MLFAVIFIYYALVEGFCGVLYEAGEYLVLEFYVLNLVPGGLFDKGDITYLFKLLVCTIFKFS